MKREIAIYSFLALFGVALAYYASERDFSHEAAGETLAAINSADIFRVAYEMPGELEVEVVRHDDSDRYWLTSTKITKDSKKDEKVISPKDLAQSESFIVNEQFQDFIEFMAPLKSKRNLGKLDNEKLKDYGLVENPTKLTVYDKAGKVLAALTLGGKSFSSSEVYAQIEGRDEVYLIEGRRIDDFKYAKSRLKETQLFDFKLDEIEAAVVKSNGQEKRLFQKAASGKGKPTWTDAAENNESASVSYQTWVNKIAKLKVADFPEPEQLAALESGETFLEIAFLKDQKELDQLIFKKVETKGADTKQLDKMDYWVKSKFLGTYVKIAGSRVATIEKDLKSIISNN